MSKKNKKCNIKRSEFLQLGLFSIGYLGVSSFEENRANAQTNSNGAKAKCFIQIWLGGGPSHLDTFDPKPKAGKDFTSIYRKPIKTNVKGIYIAQTLPLLAKQADKYSLIRGMTHGVNGHETATYLMQTGVKQGGELVYPSIGAVIAYKKRKQYKGVLPPYISLTTPLGRFSAAGFLGPQYKPFATGGHPAKTMFSVQGIVSKLKRERLLQRRMLLQDVDTFAQQMKNNSEVKKMDVFQKQSYNLMLSDAKEVFDLSKESNELRDRYGRNDFGQSCLIARRLVEKGVPVIMINYRGWDTHKKHFESMKKKLPVLDRGLSALLEDLSNKKLLDSTIVICGGEFGRTPRIMWEPPWNGGRGHFGAAFSYLVAGGGFMGGKVVGETNIRGEIVTKRPVYPWDLSASIYHLMGIDPKGKLPHPRGSVAFVTPLSNAKVKSDGMLTEIMST